MLDQQADLRENDYLFYLDVDMLFVDAVGQEILSNGITAILHPGYAISEGYKHPYEQNPLSRAYVSHQMYFCGGFQGGKTDSFLRMASTIKSAVDEDSKNGIIATFHDESHLNRYLIDNKPALVLGPAYCFPEVAQEGRSDAMRDHFVGHVWKEAHVPKILALEKPKGTR
jgi:histo-blood group ABO system transferase